MTAQGLTFEPLRLRVLEQVDGLVRNLAAIRPPAWADPAQRATGALLEARRRLEDHIRFRFGRGRGAPAIVVLIGGTGVGKSTLLNTLAGKPLTETSSRRPCTTRPLLYHHQGATEALRAPDFLARYAKGLAEPGQPKAGSMSVETMAHDDATMASVVLVDAPDFDSVAGANRRTAEDLYRIADLVIFVVNPSKYADEETWKMIRRARAEKKATAWVFNRAEPEDPAVEDFRRMLDGESVVVIPRDAEAPAAGMVRDPAARDALRGILRNLLLGDAADRLRLAELRRSWEAFSSGIDREVLPGLRAAGDTLAAARAAATAAAAAARSALLDEVRVDASSDQERIARMVRENLFSVIETLSRPVMAPLTALYDRVAGLLRGRSRRNASAIESALERVHDNNLQAARKHLGLAHESIARSLASAPCGPAFVESREFGASLLPATDIEARYRRGVEEFEEWKQAEFGRLVGDIRTRKSVQLAVLQAGYVTLTVATMAHTGGAIKLVEALFAGPLLVAFDKAFVGAINWDLVRDVAERGRKRFLEIFDGLVEAQCARWEGVFSREEAGLAAAAPASTALESVRTEVPSLLRAMAQ